MELSSLAGTKVLVAGWKTTGRSVVDPLQQLGATVVAADGNPAALDDARASGVEGVHPDEAISSISDYALVITSPGWRPNAPLFVAAQAAGVPVWGDVEFAWRVDQAEMYGPTRTWLVVTGTNGKTTTTSMLETVLTTAGLGAVACGNIGLPILDALRQPEIRVLAVELSSFQLFWAPSVHPEAGAVLNIAEDHLDWHGSMQHYIDAKTRALSGRVGVLGLDDAEAAKLVRISPAQQTVGFRLGEPGPGELGIVDGQLVDRAFSDGEILVGVADLAQRGRAGLLNALAASALARAAGVPAADIGAGLRAFEIGAHRGTVVATIDGIDYIDDSKATNPHAARIALLSHEHVVWVAGGQLKGASIDELIIETGQRLRGAVLLGQDAQLIVDALARHAPEVPVVVVGSRDDASVKSADALMQEAVSHAKRMAAPGDVVLLAPAAASLDMFTSYGHRGDSFAEAARLLGEA
ncbi:MAG: UDP-N-acetylmuramoyl-L-alanine--D-glutamate ligase [Nocardiaceae bacterium]|nr:UDP-N-acetylmuramoyl-L-alanine--D-glutamate ligase [Nocardiaceae bacterium]